MASDLGYEEVSAGSHIWLVTKELEFCLPGWYFSDETEQFNGPFNTKEEAEENLKAYVEWLDGTSGATREPPDA